MNSRFCGFWATTNHFETRLMVLSQKVVSKYPSKLLRMASWLMNILMRKKTSKMTTGIAQNLDSFLLCEFWYTGIQSPRFCKWPWILNWSKWILLVDIQTQLLLTTMGSIYHSSRCKLDVYLIAHTHQSKTLYNKFVGK